MSIRKAVACLMIVGFLIFPVAAFARTIQLGYVTAAVKTDPYCIAATKFAELVEKYTGGKIKVQLFPSGQLGNERQMIEGIRMGTQDMGLITNAPVGAFVSTFMVLDLPFIFPSAEIAHKVLDGPTGRMLLSKLDKIHIKGLAFAEGGFRHMINNVRPIYSPKDLKGLKFRVMKTPIYIGLFRALGANAVPIPWGEAFTAVQQGVVDGLEIPISVIWANKFYEVTKYLSLTGHTYSPLIFMVSGMVWNTLSPEEKKVFQKAALEAARYERARLSEIEGDLLKKLAGKGMKINEVPDKKPFQKAVRSLYKEFEGKIGKDVLNAVLKAVEKESK